LDLVGDKWTLLIVRDLAAGPRRFVELQRVLPGISTEQLRSRLNRMVADGMLTRKRYREVPPRVDYELTARARDLMPVLGELARWGYQWAWSAPRSSERVDLGAIFRLTPGMVHGDGVAGDLEFVVTDGNREGGSASYTLTLTSDGSSVAEQQADRPVATVTASSSGWIRAFSPMRDMTGLEITGERAVAERVIADLAPPSDAAGAAESADRRVA